MNEVLVAVVVSVVGGELLGMLFTAMYFGRGIGGYPQCNTCRQARGDDCRHFTAR